MCVCVWTRCLKNLFMVLKFACRTVVLTARGTQNEVPKHLTLEKVHALGICQISYPKLHGHAYHEVVALT